MGQAGVTPFKSGREGFPAGLERLDLGPEPVASLNGYLFAHNWGKHAHTHARMHTHTHTHTHARARPLPKTLILSMDVRK
jgi:hypothetical protein